MSSANLTNHFTFLECGKWLKCYTATEKMLFPIVSCYKLSFRDLWLQLYREKKFIWEWRLVVFDQEIYGVLHIWHNVHWPVFSLFHCQGMFCSVKPGIGSPFWVIFPGQALHKCVCLCAFAITRWSLDCFLLFSFFCLIFSAQPTCLCVAIWAQMVWVCIHVLRCALGGIHPSAGKKKVRRPNKLTCSSQRKAELNNF